MTTPEFQRGEIVRFVIEGPVLASDDRSMCIKTPEGRTLVLSGDDLNRIELVAPVDWPPQPGDLWNWETPDFPGVPEDARIQGGAYFAHQDLALDTGAPRLMLIAAEGDLEYDETDPGKLLAFGGRWTLIHREQQDGGTS